MIAPPTIKLHEINTIYGPGIIFGRLIDGTGYMVTFRREDFTVEQWMELSKHNGPCINKAVLNEEILEGASQ